MEARKETLCALRQCRFCLCQNETLTSLYKRKTPKNAVSLQLKIMSCIAVEVYPSDKMPTYICSRCKYFMDIFYDFKSMCRKADENILQFIESGIPLERVSWSSALAKVAQSQIKRTETAVVKTVVDSGATVQLTTLNESDTDMEDDENVYNVKIGDGSDDGKSACIKVITSNDNDSKDNAKGYTTVSKLARHVRSHVSEKAYPCKYCDKSFTKSHHYTRHLRMKHDVSRNRLDGTLGEQEQYKCDQCEDCFSSQDDLIYHSAIHATQNLICPLCQEKFDDVDAVTTHIKSHVSDTEFMCDYCELIFTTKEKLDQHVTVAHDDELRSEEGHDESGMEMDGDDDDDESAINVTEENGEMVVQIRNADNFMLSNNKTEFEGKPENTNSDESESETTYTELATVEPSDIEVKPSKIEIEISLPKETIQPSTNKHVIASSHIPEKNDNQPAIVKKIEDVKRKVVIVKQKPADEPPIKKDKQSKGEPNNIVGANDKSLRLLEKELQDLKRTNSRTEAPKSTPKSAETPRNRRLPIYASTPKLKNSGVKESQMVSKSTIMEKKINERRVIPKENKEPKESKDVKNNSAKDDKEISDKETAKEKTNVVKNGGDKSGIDEKIRRSTRPSKIKDYAKMIRDSSQDSAETSEESMEEEEDEEDIKDLEKSIEASNKQKKNQKKPSSSTVVADAPTPRKRGRPRKNPPEVQNKIIKKEDPPAEVKVDSQKITNAEPETTESKGTSDLNQSPSKVMVSPMGQTLKKVPIKALPPGIKPMPLPANPRMGSGEVCEMQIGKKLVKVQKIVMTKAEVEAMAKKGLVEMKDGTMVLKQGIKIPAAESSGANKSAVGDGAEVASPVKKPQGTPTRCDLGENA